MKEKPSKIGQRTWDKFCRSLDFEGNSCEPISLENSKMGKAQMKRLFGKGVQFKEKEEAVEYANNLASQGYRTYYGQKKGGKKWLVFRAK